MTELVQFTEKKWRLNKLGYIYIYILQNEKISYLGKDKENWEEEAEEEEGEKKGNEDLGMYNFTWVIDTIMLYTHIYRDI